MILRVASLFLLLALAGPTTAMERAIEKEVLVDATVDQVWEAWTTRAGKEWDATYQYFDKAWGSVLQNLQKRYAPGGKPLDWTEWNERIKKMSAPK